MTSPTPDGLLRYSLTGGYYRLQAGDGERYPCMCLQTCDVACDGTCGCPACRLAAADRRLRERFAKMSRNQPA